MKRDLARLKNGQFDILVIGGGINGCAIARDAQLRGAKTALIEKNDFASGASGKTTKLIHGGLRYLEQLNFKLVSEALHERAILLRTVKHLVKPLAFIFPVYQNDPRALTVLKIGVFLYDLLAGKDNIKPHRNLSKNALISLEQSIQSDGLKGGVSYYDAQMDDIWICLNNAISADNAGCVIANRVEVIGFIKEKGRIVGIDALDNLTEEKLKIYAKVIISACGAWSNHIVRMDAPDAPAITRPTKGAHIVYRKLPHQAAIITTARSDQRIFFIIPWRGYSLIGTTDTDYSGSEDEVYASGADVDYLLNETRRIFPKETINKQGIITTFAGLRPLVNTQGKHPWQVSREHLIHQSKSGLVSVIGGKYTTYRSLAEEVTDLALAKLARNNFKECLTDKIELPATAYETAQTNLKKAVEKAVGEEMANDLNDLFIRRLELSVTASRGLDRLKECAAIMSSILGWSDNQKENEINKYNQTVRRNQEF